MTLRVASLPRRRIAVIAGAGLLALAALLSCRAAPDAAGEELHRAVLRGDVTAAERILREHPAAVRARDEDGLTALHFTAVRLRVSAELAAGRRGDGPAVGGAERACGTATVFTSYDRRAIQQRLRAPPRAGADAEAAVLTLTTALDLGPMANLLLAHGAEVDARTHGDRRTPLHLAVRMGHKSVAEALLSRGADLNASDSVGLTALGMAAQSGNVALARVLLHHGALVNGPMPRGASLDVFRGDTPLALAILCRRTEMVAFLLERGADPDLAVRDGFRPLHLAESSDVAAALLDRGADMRARGHQGRSALHQAAMQQRVDVVRLLLDRGADPNARDDRGNTPLLLALSHQLFTAELVRLLVARGADVNVRSSSGATALHEAFRIDDAVGVMLLDAGAQIDAPDRYGRTVLHLAVADEDVDRVELLLARGAAVNARDGQGHTPLHETWGGSPADRRIAAVLERNGGSR